MHKSGTRLGGRYRLEQRVGAGGMGEVWRATDEVLGRAVAVKVILTALLDDEEFGRRFESEARLMASLTHPGIVGIYDFHSDEHSAYLVMEFVDGEPLSRVIRRVGRLSPDHTMNLVAQAADALQAVHDRGIVHRDVKPANLMVRSDGSVALGDFGIARSHGATALTATGAVMGTPTYLAPEQLLGHPAGPVSDVYALGLVGYECLAGRLPFEGESPFAVAMRRLHEPPQPLGPEVPHAVREVINSAIAIEPAQRWSSARDFASAARRANSGEVPTRPVSARHVAPTSVMAGPAAPPYPTVVAPPPPTRSYPTPPEVVFESDPDTPASPVIRPVRTHRLRRVLYQVAMMGFIMAMSSMSIWGKSFFTDGFKAFVSDYPTTVPSPLEDYSTAKAPGFDACGNQLCPIEPTCWNNYAVVRGASNDAEPEQIPCSKPHYWQTFRAGRIPKEAAGKSVPSLDHGVPEIDKACSTASRDRLALRPKQAESWNVHVWIIQLANKSWTFQCVAGPGGSKPTTGSMFKTTVG